MSMSRGDTGEVLHRSLWPSSHRMQSTSQHVHTNYGTYCGQWECSHSLQHQKICMQICGQMYLASCVNGPLNASRNSGIAFFSLDSILEVAKLHLSHCVEGHRPAKAPEIEPQHEAYIMVFQPHQEAATLQHLES